MSSRQRIELADHETAIRDYLDALLRDVGEAAADEPPTEPPPEAEADAGTDPSTVVPWPRRADEAEDAPSAQEAFEEPPAPATAPEPPAAAEEGAAESDPEAPGWVVGGAFQALFFTVGGLTLAVPLTELHSVVPAHDVDITPMPNQPEWQIGLMRYRNRNVRIIDTATMVLPPDKRQSDEARAQPEHILVVGDGSWGLACHAIGDVVRLTEDEVKWRRNKTTRRWLAGTVIGHLSALVDARAFTDMLEQWRRG